MDRSRTAHWILALASGLLLLAVSVPVYADQLEDLQRSHDRLVGHQGRLESQLTEQGKRIRRLKAQPAGVARDYQLKATLRASQQLAARLMGLQRRIHTARTALIAAFDTAIRKAEGKLKTMLSARRARLARGAQAGDARIVTGGPRRADASAEDLDEQADLLKDSEEKVRRQLRRLQRQLGRLQHRARLRRHARAADDNPFVENAPRRTSRVAAARKATEPEAPQAARSAGRPANATGDDLAGDGAAPPPATPAPPSADADTKSSQGAFDSSTDMSPGEAPSPAPAPQPTGTGGWTGGGGDAAGGVAVSVQIRDVIDPSLLRQIGRMGQRGKIEARIAALRKATAKLGRLAGHLSKKARTLRSRARTLRSRKR